MRWPKNRYFMSLAQVASCQSTCIRRSVGCVLVDEHGYVLSVGYNGVASGQPHCNEGHECKGFELKPGQDFCEAIHAEQNALIQCSDIKRIHRAFVTTSPCRSCIKLLLNTSCQEIVFLVPFEDHFAESLWTNSGRRWTRYQDESINEGITV